MKKREETSRRQKERGGVPSGNECTNKLCSNNVTLKDYVALRSSPALVRGGV